MKVSCRHSKKLKNSTLSDKIDLEKTILATIQKTMNLGGINEFKGKKRTFDGLVLSGIKTDHWLSGCVITVYFVFRWQVHF